MKTRYHKVKQLLIAAFAWNETRKNITKNENSHWFDLSNKEKMTFYW